MLMEAKCVNWGTFRQASREKQLTNDPAGCLSASVFNIFALELRPNLPNIWVPAAEALQQHGQQKQTGYSDEKTAQTHVCERSRVRPHRPLRRGDAELALLLCSSFRLPELTVQWISTSGQIDRYSYAF